MVQTQSSDGIGAITPPAHVPALDGFRGASALLVAIFHCWLYTDPPLDSGAIRALVLSFGLGVDFFFVISGFVLFLPVVRHGGTFGSLRSYAIRRVARIMPAYYIALVIQAAATPLLTQFASPFASPGGWVLLGIHFLFLQHSVPRWLLRQFDFEGSVMGFGVNGALWSLSIEALFYAFLPLVAGFYFRRPRLGFALGLGTALGWRWLAFHLPSVSAVVGAGNAVAGNAPRLLEQFPGYFAHFAFGMAAAFLYVRAYGQRERSDAAWWMRKPGALQAGLFLVLILSMIAYGNASKGAPVGVYERYFDDIVPAFAFAGLMLTTALGTPRAQWLMANPISRWLGDVSYGAFLWHFPLILLFGYTLGWVQGKGDAQFFELTGLVLPGALLLGWLSRRFVEEPAIAWARRRTS